MNCEVIARASSRSIPAIAFSATRAKTVRLTVMPISPVKIVP